MGRTTVRSVTPRAAMRQNKGGEETHDSAPTESGRQLAT